MSDCKFHVLLLIALLGGVLAQSQTPVDEAKTIIEGYNKLYQESNENKRNYHLNLLSEQWMSLLQRADFEYPHDENNRLKQLVSADSVFTVYYFLPKNITESTKIDLFITHHADTLKPNTFYFSDAIKLPIDLIKDSETNAPELKIDRQKIANIDYYNLQIVDSKSNDVLYQYHDIYLKYLFEQIAQIQNFDTKLLLNKVIQSRLNNFMAQKENLTVTLEGIGRLSTLSSTDNKVKICTWGISKTRGDNTYYGTITTQLPNGSIKQHSLTDVSENIKSPEKSLLTASKWYGAIYFDLVETQYKKQKFYTLLGYKENGEFTKIKLLDVLMIDNQGIIKFGHNIFHKNPGFINRIIFQYSASINMLMKYDDEKKMIVVDNLAPSKSEYKDNFRFYGPDFSHNGYRFEKGKWMVYLNLELRNPKKK